MNLMMSRKTQKTSRQEAFRIYWLNMKIHFYKHMKEAEKSQFIQVQVMMG